MLSNMGCLKAEYRCSWAFGGWSCSSAGVACAADFILPATELQLMLIGERYFENSRVRAWGRWLRTSQGAGMKWSPKHKSGSTMSLNFTYKTQRHTTRLYWECTQLSQHINPQSQHPCLSKGYCTCHLSTKLTLDVLVFCPSVIMISNGNPSRFHVPACTEDCLWVCSGREPMWEAQLTADEGPASRVLSVPGGWLSLHPCYSLKPTCLNDECLKELVLSDQP